MKEKLQAVIDLLDEAESRKVYSGLELIVGEKMKDIEKREGDRSWQLENECRDYFTKQINTLLEICMEGDIVDLYIVARSSVVYLKLNEADTELACDIFMNMVKQDRRLQVWQSTNFDIEPDQIVMASHRFKNPCEAVKFKKYIKLT